MECFFPGLLAKIISKIMVYFRRIMGLLLNLQPNDIFYGNVACIRVSSFGAIGVGMYSCIQRRRTWLAKACVWCQCFRDITSAPNTPGGRLMHYHQGLRHVFRIGGTGTVGAQLETSPNTHLPRNFRFSSDFVHFILGIIGKNQK